jgi:hypothetical protein
MLKKKHKNLWILLIYVKKANEIKVHKIRYNKDIYLTKNKGSDFNYHCKSLSIYVLKYL